MHPTHIAALLVTEADHRESELWARSVAPATLLVYWPQCAAASGGYPRQRQLRIAREMTKSGCPRGLKMGTVRLRPY